ncbi:hypothetical protein LINPERPRIM_LOCUS17298 [Linum perenne]
MSSTSKAWAGTTSIGAVEALKNQLGFCKWNYVIISAQQYAKNNIKSITRPPPKISSISPTSADLFRIDDDSFHRNCRLLL